MKRRLLALLLVLTMLLPMIPMGTLAEDVETQELDDAAWYDATARMTSEGLDGVEVNIAGSAGGATSDEVYLVAASFDKNGKMLDAGYNKVDKNGDQGVMHLYNTPEGAPIYVYVLNEDLQPVTTERFQADWEYRGWYGDNEDIRWSFQYDRLGIYGYDGAEMPEGDYPWSRFAKQAKDLTLYGISTIADNAFRGFTELESIWIDSGVTAIGEAAFYGVEKAEVHVDEEFDWDNLILAPGNDIIERARPSEPVEEIPDLDQAEPETTEATVPETIEETVPETVEEPAAEEEPTEEAEELTAEEAAQEGYYVAPEGAQLLEDAALEELAAFTGTDKAASKGQHIAKFTGLVPYEQYTFLVSATPGSLEDLKYIGFADSDSDGDAAVGYIPKDEGKAIVQLYGPEKLTLTTEQTYITLKPGQTAQVRLASNEELKETNWSCDEQTGKALNISADPEDNTLWNISIRDAYLEELRQVETRYVTFLGYENGQGAAVTVRVDLIPEQSTVKGATFGETAITHNYYSSEATPIPVFLEINVPERDPESMVDTQAAFDGAEKTGLIRDAAFSEDTDSVVKQAFELRVQDDHTLLLLTKETAENAADGGDIDFSSIAKRLKSSYKVGFVLTVRENGQEKQVPVAGSLKLNVQKKLPTLKAQAVTLNTYANATGTVAITGGQVERIEKVTGSAQVTLAYNEDEGTVTAQLLERPTKSGTVNLTAVVMVKGCNQPVTLKVSVKVDTKTPALKLGKTSLNTYSILYTEESIPVLCTTKGVAVEDLSFGNCDIQDAKGNDLNDYYSASIYGGRLSLYSYSEARPVGKLDLVIKTNIEAYYPVSEDLSATLETPVSFKLTVNDQEPSVKLDKSDLLLNVGVLAGVPIKASITGIPEDTEYDVAYFIQGDSYITDEVKAGKYFELAWDGVDTLILKPNFDNIYSGDPDFDLNAFLRDTYTLYIGVQSKEEDWNDWALAQDKWAKVRVTLTEDAPEITSLKSSGTIDLSNDNSRVTLTPTYGGKQSIASVTVDVTDADGYYYSFDSYMDGEKVLIGRSAGEDNLKPGTYTATVNVWWGYGRVSEETTFKVVQGKPTLKVTGKLDSGKENSALSVVSSYKHNVRNIWNESELQLPEVALLSAGNPVDSTLYNVELDEAGNFKIMPRVFGEKLLPAGKYTLTLTYGDKELVQTASVTVTQTVPTLKLSKTSVTLHPEFEIGEIEDWNEWVSYENAVSINSTYSGAAYGAKYEFYQANGKTQWDGQPYVRVVEFNVNGSIVLGPAGGEVPEKDTTVKIKVTPDSRIPNKFGWITVKVLGGKSLAKKITLKAVGALDPSYSYTGLDFTVSASGFDNKNIRGNAILEEYSKQEGWQEVENYEELGGFYDAWAEGNYAHIGMHDLYNEDGERVQRLDPNGKYRMVVSYSEHVSTIVNLKVAYSKNKFTADKAIVLYKQDYNAGMNFHINQQNMEQQISDVVIKNQAKTGFILESNNNTPYSKNDWTIRYTGDAKKLKTTTLTLQIYLKGNEYVEGSKTQKPNATMNLKVTVK